ncbi:hypothetical protein J3E69DRAFT_343151 [Trichoderma sp. SZMC 28015]
MQNSSSRCFFGAHRFCRCCAPFRFSRRTRRDASSPANRRRPRQQTAAAGMASEGKFSQNSCRQRRDASPAAGAGRQKPFEQRPRRSCSFSLRICHCMLMQLVQFRKCSACCVLFAFAPPTPVGDFGLALRVRELIAWPNCASLSCPSLQLALCHSTTTTPPLPLTAEEIENVLSSSLRLARFSLSPSFRPAAASPLLPPTKPPTTPPPSLACHCYFKHPLASASASLFLTLALSRCVRLRQRYIHYSHCRATLVTSEGHPTALPRIRPVSSSSPIPSHPVEAKPKPDQTGSNQTKPDRAWPGTLSERHELMPWSARSCTACMLPRPMSC